MNTFTLLKLESTTHQAIVKELKTEAIPESETLHITATSSLASAFMKKGLAAVPVSVFIDALTLSSVDCALPLIQSQLPNGALWQSDSPQIYKQQIVDMQKAVANRGSRMKSTLSQALRDYSNGTNELEIRELSRNLTNFHWTIRALNDMNVELGSMAPKSGLSEVAISFLKHLDPSHFLHERKALWDSLVDSAIWNDLFEIFLGVSPTKEIKHIVLHGFFFYSSIQFAFFQFLKSMPDTKITFAIHDDGQNPAFEIWREFYDSNQWIEGEVRVGTALESVSESSLEFSKAFRGGVKFAMPESKLKLFEFTSNVALAQQIRHEAGISKDSQQHEQMVFAPFSNELDRTLTRLIGDPAGNKTHFADTAVGLFIQSVHTALRFDHATAKIYIQLDIATCQTALESLVPAERRRSIDLQAMLSYFQGCESGESWKQRLRQLEDLRASFNLKFNESPNKFDDLSNFAATPISLLPWLSCFDKDFQFFASSLSTFLSLVIDVATQERQRPSVYREWLRERLKTPLTHFDKELVEQVDAALKLLAIGGQERFDVAGLADLVLASLSTEVQHEDIEIMDEKRWVHPLLNMDQFAFDSTSRSLHITNLSADNFPRKSGVKMWPFEVSEFGKGMASESASMLNLELLRGKSAPLIDKYLLWLGLEVTTRSDQTAVTLSFSSYANRKTVQPSPVFALLGELRGKASIEAANWGERSITLTPFTKGGTPQALADLAPATVAPAMSRLPNVATASGAGCERRFALQWMLQPTPKFRTSHTFGILLGNMALPGERQNIWSSEQIGEDNWSAALSPMAWESAKAFRVIKGTSGARQEWIWNLSGSRTGQGLADLGYKALLAPVQWMRQIQQKLQGINLDAPLPSPTGANLERIRKDICPNCPVKDFCALAI